MFVLLVRSLYKQMRCHGLLSNTVECCGRPCFESHVLEPRSSHQVCTSIDVTPYRRWGGELMDFSIKVYRIRVVCHWNNRGNIGWHVLCDWLSQLLSSRYVVLKPVLKNKPFRYIFTGATVAMIVAGVFLLTRLFSELGRYFLSKAFDICCRTNGITLGFHSSFGSLNFSVRFCVSVE